MVNDRERPPPRPQVPIPVSRKRLGQDENVQQSLMFRNCFVAAAKGPSRWAHIRGADLGPGQGAPMAGKMIWCAPTENIFELFCSAAEPESKSNVGGQAGHHPPSPRAWSVSGRSRRRGRLRPNLLPDADRGESSNNP